MLGGSEGDLKMFENLNFLLESHFYEYSNILGKHSGNAATLASTVIAEYESENSKLLFPCGTLKRNELEDTLNPHKISLDNVICYSTLPRQDLKQVFERMNSSSVDFVVFFSPSGVKSAYELLKQTIPEFVNKTKLIAIGPTTAEILKKIHTFSNILVASKPNVESVVQLIQANLN